MGAQASKGPKGRRRGAAGRYTVRGVPGAGDQARRRHATAGGKSLNQVVRDLLVREAGGEAPVVHDDLDELAGAWEDDPHFDEAIRDQDRIDESLWR
jgi:hypothetical protein